MPPRPTVTREQVLDAAFELVRTEGLTALSARRVAQALGCSTQPVYRSFRSMEELKDEVLQKAGRAGLGYLLADDTTELPFLQTGMGSLQFAQQEPHLYRAVTQSAEVLRDIRLGKPPPDFILQRMRQEPPLAKLSDAQLSRIHTLLWFFSQGLATLFLQDSDQDPMPAARDYLMAAGQAVIAWELNRSES